MPFPRIPSRLHKFRIVMTEAESALLDLYARELGTDRESAAGLAMNRTLMTRRLVQQMADESAEKKIMTALKFRCPKCGAETGIIERETGCRVETRISRVEGDELVRGNTIATKPGEVVAYACDLCGTVIMDDHGQIIQSEEAIIAWLRSRGMIHD